MLIWSLVPTATSPGLVARPQLQPRPAGDDTLARLREALVGELQAINQYEQYAARAADPRVQALFLHIARDEKEHVVELLRQIVSLDPQQAQEFARPPQA